MLTVTERMLTVRQPWADLLVPDEHLLPEIRDCNPDLAARLPKDVENRGYGTPWYPATLIVHAGKELDEEAIDRLGLRRLRLRFVRGAVVGVVRLVDVVTDSPSWWAQPGNLHWRVADPVRLRQPVYCRGFQGLRVPTPAVRAAVLSALAHQRATATTTVTTGTRGDGGSS